MLQRRGGQGRREAFVAEDDPGDLVVDGLGNTGLAARKEAPLEVIALDDNRARDLAVAAPLELRSNIDESCAVAHGFERGAWRQTRESRPGGGKQLIE